MEVKLIWPVAGRGRPRKRHIPDVLSTAAEDMLANAKWQNVSWRNATKGRLEARFAAVRVRTVDGPPQRIKDMGQQHLPGDEAWLIGEHRTSGREEILSRQYAGQAESAHVSRHDQSSLDLRTSPSAVEEELGLDHFEDDPGMAFIVMRS